MTQIPVRQTERMHLGRISHAEALYFVTLVTKRREPWLGATHASWAFLDVLRRWHGAGEGVVLAITVMPDHAHVLFQLGARQGVGQAVARWKSETRRAIGYAGFFQRDFWEHRLRETEAVDDYALYIFLNPYRAGLLPVGALWPGWWTPHLKQFSFSTLLAGEGTPSAEWLEWPPERFADLAHGE